MTIEIVVQPQPRAWLEHSILQPYVLRYGDHLRSGRYAPSTQRVYLCCVAHFAHWLTSERYELPAVDEKAAARFVAEHLPSCTCPYPVRRLVHEIRAALARLLEVLRADGIVPSGGLDVDDDLGQELARFDGHMRNVWGLAGSTREQRCRIVSSFLIKQFPGRPIIPSAIKSDAVRRFILDAEEKRSAGTINVIGGAIACYLRFRRIAGDPVKRNCSRPSREQPIGVSRRCQRYYPRRRLINCFSLSTGPFHRSGELMRWCGA